MSPDPVAVVGGGITGLAAAHGLAGRGLRVVVFESAERWGGVVATRALGEVLVEEGPDSFLDRDPAARSLCEAVGLGDELVAPAAFGAVVWSRGRLHAVPAGFPHGLPISPWAAWRSGILSPLGAGRAAADFLLPGPLRGPDISVGAFVRRRFGRATLAQLVDPLLAGTRAGEAEDMSLAAALPQVDSLARRHRSVIRGLRHARRSGALESGPPPFLTVRGGLGRLVEHLVRDLEGRAELHAATTVERLEPVRGGFVVHLLGGGKARVAGVILAVPAHRASGLLEETSPAAAAELAAIAHASVAVATLVYPPGTFDPPAGTSGMLVAGGQGRTLSACSWVSTKWPHSAPGGETVIRAFAGRAGRHPALDLDDGRLTARLASDLRDALGIATPPARASVTRWEKGLPQYAVGHLERVARIEGALARWPRLALAGASYRGSGLPDCIRQARAAAERIVAG